jgi:hypothetical protein
MLALEEIALDIALIDMGRQALDFQLNYLHFRVVFHLNQLSHFFDGHLQTFLAGRLLLCHSDLVEVLRVKHGLFILQHPLLGIDGCWLFKVGVFGHAAVVQSEGFPIIGHA